jgi:hypothetical protein
VINPISNRELKNTGLFRVQVLKRFIEKVEDIPHPRRFLERQLITNCALYIYAIHNSTEKPLLNSHYYDNNLHKRARHINRDGVSTCILVMLCVNQHLQR